LIDVCAYYYVHEVTGNYQRFLDYWRLLEWGILYWMQIVICSIEFLWKAVCICCKYRCQLFKSWWGLLSTLALWHQSLWETTQIPSSSCYC